VGPKDLSPGEMCIRQAPTWTELASPTSGPLPKAVRGWEGRGHEGDSATGTGTFIGRVVLAQTGGLYGLPFCLVAGSVFLLERWNEFSS